MRDHLKYSHVERSLDSRLICARLENTTIVCNVYAPSGSQRRAEREDFFRRLLPFYLRNTGLPVILAGDFNCVLNSKDSSCGGNLSPALRSVVDSLKLCDSWECLKGNTVEFSYIANGAGSRIDRFYVSSYMQTRLRTTNMHVTSFSDHKALSLRLCLPCVPGPRRNRYWQLRPHVLTSENIEEFGCKWNYWTRQRRNFGSWMEWWIHFAKPKIKSFFKWKTNEKYSEFRLHHDILYAELKSSYGRYLTNPGELTNINRIKGKLLLLQRQFSEDFAKINEVRMCGESLSTFQLGQGRQSRTHIDRLETDDGLVLDDENQIFDYITTYYRDLYAHEGTTLDDNFTCSRIIPENCVINNSSMEEITYSDLLRAIKSSAPRKSPGPDGIPIEFYRRTLEIIRRELVLILNEALNGHIIPQFVDGVIVLVRKGGDGNTLAFFRPISLLNTDYKLLAKVLKPRVDDIIREWRVISPAQKCSNKPCNIFQAILSVKERIIDLQSKKQAGKLISFDLSQAFDRVDREFLFSTMNSLGFDSGLVRLIRTVGDQSSSRILINGSLSPSFPIRRSVRQGDPLSMHLFILYIHPLITRLEGVCCDQDDLINAYADDISVVTTSLSKIEAVKNLFVAYGLCSGARLNLHKTKSIDIGHLTNVNRIAVPWLATEQHLRLLGIQFGNNIRDSMGINWDRVVQKFRQLVFIHRARDLNLMQKVFLLNTFLLPKLWFVASVCGARALDTAKVSHTIGCFLWDGYGGFRVPLQQLALPRKRGGLNLHIPVVNGQALLTNRYVTEQASLRLGAQHIACAGNPPNIASIPSSYPCLRSVVQLMGYIPPTPAGTMTTRLLRKTLVHRLPDARVVATNATTNWARVWMTIGSQQLSSKQREALYLLVNNKIQHGELLRSMGRSSSAACPVCSMDESLEHKFVGCPRVIAAWNTLLQAINAIVPGFTPSFLSLRFPELRNVCSRQRIPILSLFANYIIHIVGNNDAVIDINILKCSL